MTPFERRLSVALHAYVDGVNLDQPAAAVVDEVLARPASPPRWRIPTGIAAGLLIVAGALAGIQALEGMAARPAQASVHGLTYAVAVVRRGEWMLLTRGGSPEGLCRYRDPQSPFVPDSCRLVEQ